MPADEKVDPEKLKYYAKSVFDHMGGAVTAAMIYLGDHMGFYSQLRQTGPVSPEGLASRLGLSERWVREWLYQQAAAKVIEHDNDGLFWLSPEAVAVLADEEHPAFGAGTFCQLPATMGALEHLPESFKTGLGTPYDAWGEDMARGVERGFAPWYRNFLVPVAIPAMQMKDRLMKGIQVADVGCGGGVAILELAKAFPQSHFYGYEISERALERAEDNKKKSGVDNVEFHNAARHPMPSDGRFDLILTFDCLHDMTRPDLIMKQIREGISSDGAWLIADIKARATFEENVQKNPMAFMMYGISIMHCMSSSLSEEDGMGLGTLGLHEGLARELAENAGFKSFETLKINHPINAFYAVRP